MTIDTLGYAEALEAAKVPRAQARAHAKAISEHVVPQLATKHDLESGLNRLALKMTGINFGIAALTVAVLALILR